MCQYVATQKKYDKINHGFWQKMIWNLLPGTKFCKRNNKKEKCIIISEEIGNSH